MIHSLKDQLLTEIKSIFIGYPRFVYFNINYTETPVFVYHTINPELFESHLLYLKGNGYKTLSIHEYLEELCNNKSISNKSILLTIDDARSSVWRFAFPLLKKYEMKATVFIIPGLTEESDQCRSNLFDVWSGKNSLDEIRNVDSTDNTLCSWQEILEMYKSGLLSIESHTLFHREVFTSLKVADFITNEKKFLPYNFCGSPYFNFSDIGKNLNLDKYLGLPLFESAPLMLAGPKLNVSPEFIAKSKEIYNTYNSDGHSSNDWKMGIKKFVTDSSNIKKYFELHPHSLTDVKEDLAEARETIQTKLGRDAGNHLCLPWTIGNSKTIKIAEELGIKSCFWGVFPNNKNLKSNRDPFLISRIKNDFIFRLPGEERKSLLSIYYYKMKRRGSEERIF